VDWFKQLDPQARAELLTKTLTLANLVDLNNMNNLTKTHPNQTISINKKKKKR